MLVIWAGGQGNLPLSILLFLLFNTGLLSYVLAAAPTMFGLAFGAWYVAYLFPDTALPFVARAVQNVDRYAPWYRMQPGWDWAGEPRQNRTADRVQEAETAVSTTKPDLGNNPTPLRPFG